MGLEGMPRRVYTYDATGGLPLLNLIATAGSYVMAAGVLAFLANVIVSAFDRTPVGPDPWRANSLEWATSSPPPEHNFDSIPPIRSERPVYDAREARSAGRVAR
jgi:heme/copper-type cytochrome/quinol oxidase subunit 1